MRQKKLWRLRTEEYSKAAFEVLADVGLSGATVEKVANHAGVSKTNVLHYFGSKKRLLEMALRFGNADLAREVRSLLIRSNTPWERVYSVIEANFSRQYFNPKIAHAWLCLVAEVPHHQSYQRIQTAIHSRMRSNLVHALDQLTDAERAEDIALSISAMIDGLWLRCGLQQGGIDRETALAQMEVLMASLFPDCPERLEAKRRISEIQAILAAG
ncbi:MULTISPECIES: transcriptional regulator BetI [Aliiroseovarius]|uniref:transcriptional regulator BetI n=1 Tax=Aliiroseovarius TaxID=1658781 RepID=UPI00156A3400|nr:MULTISPECIES: transcriptional regulator BetI [Aliiroseovarius]NRP13212.1 HTH-type transcriptional regulator BetI [Aliiroseovarius sp. xm-d-517]NRP30234.1 HTH-type transcriptional regulator BetI [Aliiroseovarius sp. xm-m-314]NRP40313.1 HTH-type transcriptional regulator BetI [Aliiroseovarius sp. xm-m-339-2]NRP43054.1 HTH-type transcriptional regulator BetI [Aliiroseovarius sp. xm-m-378]NRP61319.1 HTH-type transcriptional regulator BetI [Aliiroseovarius sp. xm-a-151]